MGKYWFKIALRAGLIFGVGFIFLSIGRHFHRELHSDHDLTIPLGSFIPFKLDGSEVGKLRSITVHRSAPKAVTGFGVSVRLNDSLTIERFSECRFSVTDAAHIDENTTFFCLKADSGYQAFGEVRITSRIQGGSQVLVQPLLLPESAIREFQHQGGDSAAAAVTDAVPAIESRVRERQRIYEDSVAAARLEKRAKDMQRQADSLRARSLLPPADARRP